MTTRTLWFATYHLMLALLAVFLQTGCTNFAGKSASSMLPWGNKQDADGQSLSALLAKGLNHEKSGRYDKAREIYQKLITQYPDSAEPAHRLAVLADKQKRHEEAQALYAHVIKMRPTDAELFNDLGYSFYLSGNLSKAESALGKAIQIEPGNPRFHNNYGMVLGQQGRLEAAFEEFLKVGSEADAHYNMAFIYASQERVEDAKLCFRRALASDPTHSKASKALESFKRFEQNGGQMIDDEFAADGRRLVPYIEDGKGNPDVDAMANFGINRQIDSTFPSAHNIPTNRTAGQATRSLHDSANANNSSETR